MNHPHRLSRQSDELGAVWYAIPAVWAVAAVVGLLVVTNWPGLLAGALPPQQSATAATLSIAPATAPSAGGDHSVPAASEVFTERTFEVSPHVEQF